MQRPLVGRRGPAPQPTTLRLLRGNPGHRPIKSEEPRPPLAAPECPAWLSADAQQVWQETVPVLLELGVLARVDRDALAAYCKCYARWKAAELFLDEHGQVYPIRGKDGAIRYMQPFPQVAIARSELQVLQRYQQEFGMTPSARTRVSRLGDESFDDDEDFFGPRPVPTPRKTS
jgi:P27 family predicted phage terminase small subunit